MCDEYIAVVDVNQYASDSDCFIPLMENYNANYGSYPTHAIGDAGYGSYNNYLYCEQVGIQKYMKFAMYRKETENASYREDPYRVKNFKRDENGNLMCPNGEKFNFVRTQNVKGNKYGRTEEIYQCENCEGCPLRTSRHKSENNRTIQLNEELTAFHNEVLSNLNSTQGALLRMNRSIQVEGAFGVIKYDRSYKRIVRKGLKAVKLEIFMVSIGFNLMKHHNKKYRTIN